MFKINSLVPELNYYKFAIVIFRMISIKSLNTLVTSQCNPKGQIVEKSALAQVMAWHWIGNKPLPQPTTIKPKVKDQIRHDQKCTGCLVLLYQLFSLNFNGMWSIKTYLKSMVVKNSFSKTFWTLYWLLVCEWPKSLLYFFTIIQIWWKICFTLIPFLMEKLLVKWALVSLVPRAYADTEMTRLGPTNINGLVQEGSISSALAMEILQSCAKPSKWWNSNKS